MKFYNTYFHATGAELQQEVAQQHKPVADSKIVAKTPSKVEAFRVDRTSSLEILRSVFGDRTS
jgi:hypothetical protein